MFEAQIPINLTGVCENSSSCGTNDYAGYTRRWITAAVFYQGDPDIKEPITIPQVPDSLTQTQTP